MSIFKSVNSQGSHRKIRSHRDEILHSILFSAKNKFAGSTRISEREAHAKEQLEWRLTSGVLIYLVGDLDFDAENSVIFIGDSAENKFRTFGVSGARWQCFRALVTPIN